MRHYHKDISAIREWLQTHNPSIHLLEWEREPVAGGIAFLPGMTRRRAAEPAKPVAIGEVVDFAKIGGISHINKIMNHYFHVAMSAVGRPLSLVEAVQFVEAEGQDGEFLLAGHIEGGLVSVSRMALPFQAGVPLAKRWGP